MTSPGKPTDSPSRNRTSRTRAPGVLLIAAYVLLALLPVLLALAQAPRTGSSFLWELGKAAGLTGFALLALQVALAARLRFIERPFGLDVVMQFHKRMAILAGGLLVAHPVLFAVATGSTALFSPKAGLWVNLGQAALAAAVLATLFALLVKRLPVDYQMWRFLHKGTLAIVVLGFAHGLAIGSDVASPALRAYWWALLLLAVGLFGWRNLAVPLWGRRRFRVASVEQETHNTWTLSLEPAVGECFPYLPGQFMFLKLIREGSRAEEHPFTISSSPTHEGAIAATIKESGDFTRTIGKTKPGDMALVEAPFGRFSLEHHDARAFLFIAGGVGITPVMSMLRYLRDTNDRRPATLLYANLTEKDIIFREVLEGMPSHIEAVHILSEAGPDWEGPRGYVTSDVIRQHARGRLADADVYLCGPPRMMRAVVKTLRSLNVAPRRIHFERFAL